MTKTAAQVDVALADLGPWSLDDFPIQADAVGVRVSFNPSGLTLTPYCIDNLGRNDHSVVMAPVTVTWEQLREGQQSVADQIASTAEAVEVVSYPVTNETLASIGGPVPMPSTGPLTPRRRITDV